MANTTAQADVERWIVAEALPKALGGVQFTKRKVSLTWGGAFECDAVSDDGTIAACISTSSCKTATGRQAIGKFHKIKADALYLLHLAGPQRRVLVFTDSGMLAHFERERARQRFPRGEEIELLWIAVPSPLADALRTAARAASAEVSPTRQSD